MFPSAAVTNDYILGGLKPHTFIPLQFWRSEVHNGVGSTGSSAGSRENRFPCLFQPPEAAPTLGPWACINTASYPPVRRWHCFFLSPSASLLQGLCDSFRLTQIIKGHFPVSNPELNHICPVPPAMVFLLQGLTLCDPPWTAARQATLYFTLSLSCPLSQWYHPTTSSSVTPVSSCPQSFPASGSFPMSFFQGASVF